MKEKELIYVTKIPEGVPFTDINNAKWNEIEKKNLTAIEQIEEEAIRRGDLQYQFIYEPIKNGIAFYQIIEANKITCRLRYCPVDGQNYMVEQWGQEAVVGTGSGYVYKRLKAMEMVLGLDDNKKDSNSPDLKSEQILEIAYQIGNKYLYIQLCDEGYDYNIYDDSFRLLDGGLHEDDSLDIYEVAEILLKEIGCIDDIVPKVIEPGKLAELAGTANEIAPAILMRLTLGNIGDEITLRNICEAHGVCVEEQTGDDKDFLIETNSFYRSEEEFCYIHGESDHAYFESLIQESILTKTQDGYVWKNCV